MEKAYAFIHIIDIAYNIDRKYTYSVPYEIRETIKIGSVVVVPFSNANKRVSGVVVGFSEESGYPRVKPIDKIMNYPFDVPQDLIHTCSFMKERFFCTFGSAFRTVIPPGVNLESETIYSINPERDLSKLNSAAMVLLRKISHKKVCTERELVEEFGDETKILLNSLCKINVLIKDSRVPEKLNEKSLYTYSLNVSPEEALELTDGEKKFSDKQKKLIEFLVHYPAATMHEIEELGGISNAIVSALLKKGIVDKRETKFTREAYCFDNVEPEKPFALSEEQAQVLDGLDKLISSEEPKAALLFGVTGSGKTRVMIETAKKVIANGKQVIVLLPEIGLASQALKAYAAAFGNRLAVIHSMLSVGERTDTYRNILAGRIDIAIGTRSAIFAPFKDLGLIAIDEEQAHTYKSEMQPKYNAIDIARFRCNYSKALMLLASATPSIESYHKAQRGIYSLFKLTNRFGEAQLPEVIIEDMREDDSVLFTDKLIGKRLSKELKEAKNLDKQSILFVNRRGYHSHISCRSCGYVFTCPNCSVSLTYHAYEGLYKGIKRMSCHYCGFTCGVPEQCFACGGTKISFSGFGTQKLQDELENDYPDLRVTRMDSDTTGGKFSHDRLIEEFARGDSDVLIGTQMISKGLDFPNVVLAGATSIDSALYMDDFRAGERTFALITQLVGRAGRSKEKGKAILQTFNPEHETLLLASTQNYEKFYESEIELRKSVMFPPFCSMAVFGISSSDEKECEKFAIRFNTILLSLYEKSYRDLKIYKFGPFKSGIYKIMGKYRQRIIIKYGDNTRARQFLSELLCEGLLAAPKGLKLDLDANPSII